MGAPFYLDPFFAPYRKTLASGTVLLRQGERAGILGILVSGTLQVTRDNRAVAEVSEPGAFLGEMAIILGQSHGATVTTVGEAEVILVPRDRFSRVGERIPQFSAKLMRTLASRLASANARIAELENSCDELYNRLASGPLPAEPSNAPYAVQEVTEEELPEPVTEEVVAAAGEEPAQAAPPVIAVPSSEPGKKSPLLARLMTCPAHEGGEAFPIYLLRKGSVRFVEDVYGITEYHGAEEGYEAVDYTLQEMHVCPICLFASHVAENFFVAETTSSSGFYMIRRSVREKLGYALDVRKALAQTLDDPAAASGPARGVREAVVAFELGIMVARTFFESDRLLFSSYGFRLIVYNLKLAQIQRRYRTAEAEAVYLVRAYDLVKENLGGFAGAQHFYTYFLAVALASRLDGAGEAQRRLEQFAKLRERIDARDDSKLRLVCGEYFLKAKNLIEAGGVPASREHG